MRDAKNAGREREVLEADANVLVLAFPLKETKGPGRVGGRPLEPAGSPRLPEAFPR